MFISDALGPSTIDRLKSLGSIDLIVGIPSYNCAHTINYVIKKTMLGIEEFFPEFECLILISDGGSTDGTQEVSQAIKLSKDVKREVIEYSGERGKGTAIKAIFESVQLLKAKSMCMVDSDLRSINPYWIDLLLRPTLEGTDLVTPLYLRHRFDGTITNFICYPFTRGVYGKRIRQPIGGDFGLSDKLVKKLLESPLWKLKSVCKFGIDIFMTHSAIANGFKIKEAMLGTKLHEAKDPAEHLSAMFNQVVDSMFNCMITYEKIWKKVIKSSSVPLIKKERSLGTPESVTINIEALMNNFRNGLRNYHDVLKSILSKNSYDLIYKKSSNSSLLPAKTWVMSSYETAAYFKKNYDEKKKEIILNAFRTLWAGRVADFALEFKNLPEEDVERKIIESAELFDEHKNYLVDIF